jgi:hypothetical protein
MEAGSKVTTGSAHRAWPSPIVRVAGVTLEVDKFGRSVNEVADVLGCDWHTVNDAVLAYGAALIDHPDRFGEVWALGLDEVLFVREDPYHRQHFSTSIVDVGRGQLLDVVPGRRVPGRRGAEPKAWLQHKGRSGWVRSASPPWTSPARIGPCSTRWSPVPPRWPILSMS